MTAAADADHIRAVVVREHGGPDVLQVQTMPVPEPGPGELLVEVVASGVNFMDVYRRAGSPAYPATPPFVLGAECAGTVVAAGTDVSDFAPGDVIATASGQATHASMAIAPAASAVRVPHGVDADLAAAVMLQGMTAHYLVNSTFDVQPGQIALVHAAAGGVGQLLVQLIKAKGAEVIATAGSADKVELARERGADHVIRYDEVDDLAAAVREHAPDGVHVVYDGVGAATFDASLAALRRRGMLVLFGASSGPVPPFEIQRLNAAGSLFLTRPTLAHYVADREELLTRANELFAAIAAGDLQVQIGRRYPLDEAPQAYRDLEGRRTVGKLLLIP